MKTLQGKRILSGMRPTGRLHIGHLSVLSNWIALQEKNTCFYFVADWHMLTTGFEDTAGLAEHTSGMLLDWLSAGIDPERSTIFVQSHIKEHAELYLLFSMIAPQSWLERCPTYKDQIQQFGEQGRDISTHGFLGYPVLQAADILMYKADAVPVGEDQLPHLEYTRELARRFNHLYRQPVFPEPQAYLAKVALLPGIDGRKMSKSYGNDIAIAATAAEAEERVRQMITDPARIRKTDPGHPEVCAVYAYQGLYNQAEQEGIGHDCRAGAVGCVACKKLLAQRLNTALEPIRARRARFEQQPQLLRDVVAAGDARARACAGRTMTEVRAAMGI